MLRCNEMEYQHGHCFNFDLSCLYVQYLVRSLCLTSDLENTVFLHTLNIFSLVITCRFVRSNVLVLVKVAT